MDDMGLPSIIVDQYVIKQDEEKTMQKGINFFFMRVLKVEGSLQRPKSIIENS
jgi:hypothetical protein